jgi:O-antigen/teichoic acid export membrane protein
VSPFLARAFPRGGFLRAAAGLGSATVAAQAIGVAAAPILARLFDPAEFGALALFSTAAGLLGVVAAGRWHLAFAPAGAVDRAALASLALACAAASTLLLTALAWPVGPWAANAVGTARALWVWLAPAGAALMAVNVALRWLAIADGRTVQAARALLVRPLVAASLQIAAGLAGADEAGLILAALAGWVAADLALIPGARFAHAPGAMVAAARTWKRYPLLSLPAAGALQLVVVLPDLYIAARHGAHWVGLHAMVARVLGAPVVAAGDTLGALWWRRAAAAPPGAALGRLIDRLVLWLALPAALGAAVVVAFGPSLFTLVLGEAWREAGTMAQLLAPFHAARFISAPVLQTGAALGRLAPVSAWNAVDLGLAVLVVGAGAAFDLDLFTWLALYSGAGAASRIAALLLMRAQAAGRL